MSTSPSKLLDRASGKSLTTIAKNGIGGWLFAIAYSIITGTQQLFNLLFLPFELFARVGRKSIEYFFIVPMKKIIPAGAEQTAQGLVTFDIAGLPVGVGIVLGTFVIIGWFVASPTTSNVIPGLIVDNPIFSRIFGGGEEEEDS